MLPPRTTRPDRRRSGNTIEGGAASHYKSNNRDIEFNLFEVLGRDEVLGTGPFAEVDGATAREVLAEVDRLPPRGPAPRGPGRGVGGRPPTPAGLRPRDQHRTGPGVVQEELPGVDGRGVLATADP